MKKINKHILPKVCVLVGMALLVVGALVLTCWQWNIHSGAQKSERYVETLRALMPEPQSTYPEEQGDNRVPVLSVNGIDFIGILEMPRYEISLPVSAEWGRVTRYPCRFSGNVYDKTLQIGATTQKGQYDFYREISVGDIVNFTDTQGNCYTYTVTNLRYEKHADQTALNRAESALTLFIKNVYDFEYLIVYCNVLS